MNYNFAVRIEEPVRCLKGIISFKKAVQEMFKILQWIWTLSIYVINYSLYFKAGRRVECIIHFDFF